MNSSILFFAGLVVLMLGQVHCQSLTAAEVGALYAITDTQLYLDNRNYDDLDNDAFDTFVEAVLISLDNNNLGGKANKKFGILKDRTKLRTLVVSRNKLTSAALAAGTDALPLTSLDLSNNNINTLAVADLDFVSAAIVDINLQNNRLTTIVANQFTGAKLQRVNLGANPIRTLEDGAFTAAQLRWVKLTSNSLTSLNALAFTGSPELRTIDASYNQINSFPTATVQGLAKLRELDLSANYISKMTGDFLGDKKSLKILNLSGNQINELNLAPLNDAGLCLATLDLSNNPISDGITVTTDTNSCKRVTW